MTKSQLINVVAKKAHLTKRASEEAIDALFDEVTRSLKKGEKVVVTGFGTFEVRHRVERQGKNPRTGEAITVPAQNTPAFRAGKLLKAAVK